MGERSTAIGRKSFGAASSMLAVVCILLHAACGSDDAASSSSLDAGPASPDAGKADAARDGDVGDADSGAPTEPATLLTDDAIWSPVTARGACPLFEANVASDPFPKRTWSSCGSGAWATGCEVAPIGLAIDTYVGAYAQQTSGATFGAETYVQVSLQFPTTLMNQVFRLSDGATVAATRIDGGPESCFVGAFPHDTPLLLPVFHEEDGGNDTITFGVAPKSPGAGIAWSTAPVLDGRFIDDPFLFDLGAGFAFSNGDVGYWPTNVATFDSIVSGPAPTASVSARGDLVVWGAETASGGQVGAWSASKGAQILFTATASGEREFPLFVATSDDHIVWLKARLAADESLDTVELQWTPTAHQASDVQLTSGPVITAQTGDSMLATGGDYAAFETCDASNTCVMNVVKLSTRKTWTIGARPSGGVYAKTLAVND
ncbi:MAG TPA: hypothetical protein VF407_04910, partial [Polyangiaceae bacterium]